MSADARVCQSCALCCDGTLFTRVPLAAEDAAPPEVHAVTSPTGGRYLPQPCAALSGTRCAVYPRRPLVCRRFECLLLVALRDGEVTEAGALEVVAKARTLQSVGDRERLDAHLRMYFARR
ncbi:MAG: YkgJ family cysteine cluster protein [Myxococcota bacterium]